MKARRLVPRRWRLAIWRLDLRVRRWMARRRAHHALRDADATYCAAAPSNQTLVDIVRGAWTTAFPDEYGVRAGTVRNFEDARVQWAAGILPGGFRDRTILELGPYEAYATWQFERLGAREVTAIEASDLSFVKCLLVKELTGLRARFLHGDAIAYLDRCRDRFDVVWASGILYHSSEPLRLLRLVAAVADTVFIHTHYYDQQILSESAHAYSSFDAARDRVEHVGAQPVRLHFRWYGQPKRHTFGGGGAAFSYWMEKPDLFAALQHVGFNHIVIGADHPRNPNGPALYCLARRTNDPR